MPKRQQLALAIERTSETTTIERRVLEPSLLSRTSTLLESNQEGNSQQEVLNDRTYPESASFSNIRDRLRTAFRLKGNPVESLDLMITSLASSTLKQYEVGFKTMVRLLSKEGNRPLRRKLQNPYGFSLRKVQRRIIVQLSKLVSISHLTHFNRYISQ
ncbi:uncharacterized protein LOC117174313 isoform X2 [Belonocnema kinseyi]|uniref:uncharacterized protein LOC117174313 isoform X2 n=1 Tax=Belonocnema kinseyi TaxID=2817044 RepID=UPI00143DDEAA|nr:uncharacterized protein LOC117174313 isoform X2 [Belonocnema kinseyi]